MNGLHDNAPTNAVATYCNACILFLFLLANVFYLTKCNYLSDHTTMSMESLSIKGVYGTHKIYYIH